MWSNLSFATLEELMHGARHHKQPTLLLLTCLSGVSPAPLCLGCCRHKPVWSSLRAECGMLLTNISVSSKRTKAIQSHSSDIVNVRLYISYVFKKLIRCDAVRAAPQHVICGSLCYWDADRGFSSMNSPQHNAIQPINELMKYLNEQKTTDSSFNIVAIYEQTPD